MLGFYEKYPDKRRKKQASGKNARQNGF